VLGVLVSRRVRNPCHKGVFGRIFIYLLKAMYYYIDYDSEILPNNFSTCKQRLLPAPNVTDLSTGPLCSVILDHHSAECAAAIPPSSASNVQYIVKPFLQIFLIALRDLAGSCVFGHGCIGDAIKPILKLVSGC
jgi:hypothetical protein